MLIGTDPDCAIRIEAPGIAPHHAMIVFLNGTFWLEALAPVYHQKTEIQRHELVQLVPGKQMIELGQVRVNVAGLRQLSLDIPI